MPTVCAADLPTPCAALNVTVVAVNAIMSEGCVECRHRPIGAHRERAAAVRNTPAPTR
jgi:hypothetical protein